MDVTVQSRKSLFQAPKRSKSFSENQNYGNTEKYTHYYTQHKRNTKTKTETMRELPRML